MSHELEFSTILLTCILNPTDQDIILTQHAFGLRPEGEKFPKDQKMLSAQDRASVKSKMGSYLKDEKMVSSRDRVTVNSKEVSRPKYQRMMSTPDPLPWEAEPRPYSKFEELMKLPPWDVTTVNMEREAGDKEQEGIPTTQDEASTESEADVFFKDQELIATHDAIIMESRAEAAARALRLSALGQDEIDLDAVMNGYTGIRLLTADGSHVDITEVFARRSTYLSARLDANCDDRVMTINTSEVVVKKLIHWYQYHRYWPFNIYFEGRHAFVRAPQITEECMKTFFDVKHEILRPMLHGSITFQLEDLGDATIEQIRIRFPPTPEDIRRHDLELNKRQAGPMSQDQMGRLP